MPKRRSAGHLHLHSQLKIEICSQIFIAQTDLGFVKYPMFLLLKSPGGTASGDLTNRHLFCLSPGLRAPQVVAYVIFCVKNYVQTVWRFGLKLRRTGYAGRPDVCAWLRSGIIFLCSSDWMISTVIRGFEQGVRFSISTPGIIGQAAPCYPGKRILHFC